MSANLEGQVGVVKSLYLAPRRGTTFAQIASAPRAFHATMETSVYPLKVEIGGSHAHRLKKLIEHLGLDTLVITDIDAKERERAEGASHQGRTTLADEK